MKLLHFKPIAALMALFAPIVMYADVIVLEDGSSMNVFNVEAAKKWIYYTETDSEDAPVQRIPIEKVFGYKIGDGKMQTVGGDDHKSEPVSETKNEDSSEPVLAQPKIADNNNDIINAYNTSAIVGRSKPKNKIYSGFIATLWGLTSESIMADENVTVGFEENEANSVKGYRIRVENKGNKPVYIDLTNSFKIDNNGNAEPFFTNSVYTTSKTGGSGMSVNAGAVAGAIGVGGAVGKLASGINVGGGSSSGAQVSQAEQPVLVVPPHSAILLPGSKEADGNTIVEYPLVFSFCNDELVPSFSVSLPFTLRYVKNRIAKSKASYDDKFYSAEQMGVKENDLVEFSESESPKTQKFIITYSPYQDFNTYYQLPVGVYLRGIFGKDHMLNVKGEPNWEKSDPGAPMIWGYGKIVKKTSKNGGGRGLGAALRK